MPRATLSRTCRQLFCAVWQVLMTRCELSKQVGWRSVDRSLYKTHHLLLPQAEHGYFEGSQHDRINRYRIAPFDTVGFPFTQKPLTGSTFESRCGIAPSDVISLPFTQKLLTESTTGSRFGIALYHIVIFSGLRKLFLPVRHHQKLWDCSIRYRSLPSTHK